MLIALAAIWLGFPIQEVAELVAQETLRIGHVSREGHVLTEVEGMVLTDSAVWIGQPEDGSIAVFSLEGHRTGTIGRKGRGPGEFINIAYLTKLGDTIAVGDAANGRTTVFVSGKLRDTWSPFFAEDRDMLPSPAVQLFADGSVLGRGSTRARNATGTYPLFASHPDSGFLGTIAVIDRKDSGAIATDPESGLRMYFTPPIVIGDIWKTTQDQIAVLKRGFVANTDSAFARLIVLTPRGDTIGSARFAGVARQVPETFYDSKAEELAQLATEGRPFPRALVLRMIQKAVHRYPTQPLFDDMVAGEDGIIWLKESAVGAREARWLGFSFGSRRFEMAVKLSSKAKVIAARFREIWAVVPGSYEEPYVVRYNLIDR